MERTIRVTGKGKVAVKPDLIRLMITQEDTLDTYEDAVRESTEMKGMLNKLLEKLGFDKTDIKTLHFNVETVYESYQTKDKSWKRRLEGYKYVHSMKIEFSSDNEMLGKVLYSIAGCPGNPEFSIEYTTSDPEAAKNELLKNAIADSKTKAEVLSKAAGVELGEIITIDYSWSEVDFVSRPVDEMMLRTCCDAPADYSVGSYDIDIEADDIKVTDTVTVVWSIC